MTREEAIEILSRPKSMESVPDEILTAHAMAIQALEGTKWIPCSERLPEDSQFVLMTIRRMDKHYNHKPFISVGYITWNQSLWWCAHDGDCEPNNVKVDAWMPLPEPWEGEEK